MGHEILGERFISRTKPAWHELGIIFPEDETVLAGEAVKRVAGDVKVVARQEGYHAADGVTWVPNPGRQAIIRLP